MENILIVFLNNLKDIEGFNKIIDEFDKRGYKMYLYDNIKDTDFEFSELPEVVEYYKNQHESVNKVVVLSNLRDLIFAWYRCYNSVVDDFVYFIDEDENNFFDFEDRHYDFFHSLSNFNNIKDDMAEGKIYMNINYLNYRSIFSFILCENRLSCYENLDNFDFDRKTQKKNIIRKYIYKGYEYSFDYPSIEKTNQIIRINELTEDEININNNLIKSLLNNGYIIPFMTTDFYKRSDEELTSFLVVLFKELKNTTLQVKKNIFDKLYYYINNCNIEFKEKVYIASLLVLVCDGNEQLTKFIMKTLLNDEENLEYHYEILVNVLFYISMEGLEKYNEYYLDKKNITEKLAKWTTKNEQLSNNSRENNFNNNNKRIAIVVDQLLSIKHSPTKIMLDYAKNIKKYYPEYEVKVFVEDNLYCPNTDRIISYAYSSGISQTCIEEHIDYLNNKDIHVYYSDLTKEKKTRTWDFIREINKFQPEVILTNSDMSLSTRILYDYFPIVYMSMGGDYFSNMAHIYLSGSKDKIIKSNNKYGLLNEDRISEFKYGLEFNKPSKVIKREDYNIKESDFVMVTVGNRLDAEIDEEFIDYLSEFIGKNEHVKWLVLGPKDIPYLEEKYYELLSDKIIKIKYENDLPALYRICDIYVNPRRQGGGISIAMAMNEELPIILTKSSTDGVLYTGEENASGDSMEEYINDLNKAYRDKYYINEKKVTSKQRIKFFIIRASVDLLVCKINELCKSDELIENH